MQAVWPLHKAGREHSLNVDCVNTSTAANAEMLYVCGIDRVGYRKIVENV